MQRDDKNRLYFSPSDLTRYYESEFTSWMDRYAKFHSEDGTLEGVHRNPPDPLAELLKQKGIAHEEAVCKPLRERGGFIEIAREGHQDQQLAKTLEVMKSGAPLIYQAALKNECLFGYADLLERKEGKSKLGDYFYMPVDMKLSANPKPTAILQLCAYADMLLSVQGALPLSIAVITRDGKRHDFRTDCFFYFYLRFKKTFLEFHETYSKDGQPLPQKNDDHRDWAIYAQKVLHQRDDIALTARIRQSHIEALQTAGITTLTLLSQCKKKEVEEVPDTALATLVSQAALQVKSKGKRPPLYTIHPHPSEKRMGLAMLPEPHPKDIFFDMEGYPLLGAHGLEYLYGVAERGENKYSAFWAYKPEDEGKTFVTFLDWVFDRWKKNPGMRIYHYSAYEPSTLKRLMGKYGFGDRMIADLLRHEVFVDLYAVVVQGLQIGTYSYGLKAIETLYYPERETDVSSGAQSAVEFAKWLDSPDHIDPTKSEFLTRIRDYNRDDCWSTRDLEAFLQSAKKKSNVTYIPMQGKVIEDVEDPEKTKNQCSKLAENLIATVPLEKRGRPLNETDEVSYLTELLAQCLDFHRREESPEWWDYYRRRDMSREQLARDSETIVDVKIEGANGKERSCSFSTDQDTKLRVGDEVLILENEDPFEKLEIIELDIIHGTLKLKGDPKQSPPEVFTLAPAKSYISKESLQKSILRQANEFGPKKKHFGLRKCIHDLLLKRHPDVKDRRSGAPLLPAKKDSIQEICDVVLSMNDTVLCLQGPPGTGKTFTGSRVIAALLAAGKTVVVSSNSHKAINHLLFKANTVCQDKKIPCRPLKVSSANTGEDEEVFAKEGVPLKAGKKAEALLASSNLVGATAFFLSKETLQDSFDYLIVDEATQVALPNLIAMAHCARNIVLLGDQMQLEQPLKAVHPGDSGRSALVHLTQGKSIVPPDFGIFLALTYRMHSSVCRIVSDSFYEGALLSATHTENQSIAWKKAPDTVPSTGVHFVPVEHTGNKHGSEEEVEEIEKLVEAALKSDWYDEAGKKRAFTPNDILIVSPYNYQVALLQDRLGDRARIGTVDIFQGQEAPLVILSLCASSASEAPRGLGFLLNKNRVNVAISRAKCLALVVGSPAVWEATASSINGMELLNTMCRISNPNAIVEGSTGDTADASTKKLASKKGRP